MVKFQVIVQNQEDQVWDCIRAEKEQALFKIVEDIVEREGTTQLLKSAHWALIFGNYDVAVKHLQDAGYTVTVKELNQ